MLDPNIVLETAGGTDVTLNLIKSGENGTVRTDIGQANGNARTLSIRHSRQGNKTEGFSQRHNILVNHQVLTSAGDLRAITASLTLQVPEDPNVAWSHVYDDLAIILDLVTDGALVVPMTTVNLARILRGES